MKLFALVLSTVITSAAFADVDITPAEANQLVEQGKATLIDVREKDEVEESGLAKPALWLPMSEIKNNSDLYKKVLADLDKSKTLIFYCASGRRSGMMAKHFGELNFQTKNSGGFKDWVAAKLPIRKLEKPTKPKT